MMPQNIGKIGLVGAGAVGSYYGLMLSQGGEDVHFKLRSNYDEVKKDGFNLIHRSMDNRNELINTAQIYKDTKDIGPCDWVIIATKATANHELCTLIEPLVNHSTSFLTLQNGMGNVENIENMFGRERLIVGGLCFTCINRTAPNTIESLLPGYVQFGQLGEKLSCKAIELVDAFNKCGVTTRKTDSLEEALWRKLCWNVPFNGLSISGGGITTDQILCNSALRNRAALLMREIQQAAHAYGIMIEDEFLDKQFSLTEPMGKYKPSSLIDYLDQKPVEVEAIWGEPLRKGELKGLNMPELKMLYEQLLEIA